MDVDEPGEGLLEGGDAGVADEHGVRLVPAVLFGALLAGGQLFHSVLDSLLTFAALHTGHAPFGYADWSGRLGWAVLGNLVGGLGLVTFVRLGQVPHRVAEERRRNRGRPSGGLPNDEAA